MAADFENPSTAYDIIAKCLELTHERENVYRVKSGKAYILTKFGFQDAVQVNSSLLQNELIKFNENLSNEIKRLKKNVKKLNDENVKLIHHLSIYESKKDNGFIYLLGKKNRKTCRSILMNTDLTKYQKNRNAAAVFKHRVWYEI